MKRLAALALLLAACGGAPESPIASFAFALSPEDASRITQLQVELVRAGSIDCGTLETACFKDLGVTPVPFAGDDASHAVYRAPFTAADESAPIDLQVTPGTYLVNVEALDGDGQLVANACKLSVTFASGASVDVDLTLASYTGTACDAAM